MVGGDHCLGSGNTPVERGGGNKREGENGGGLTSLSP